MAARTTKATAKKAKKTTAKGNEKQPAQHGVTRPKAGTSTGRVWELADRITAKTKEAATRAAVLEAFTKEGGNPATGATQFSRWRTFNGLKRVPAAE